MEDKPKKKIKDWIVLDAQRGGAFVCKRCGDSNQPAYPVAIKEFLAMSKSFEQRHSKCQAKEVTIEVI